MRTNATSPTVEHAEMKILKAPLLGFLEKILRTRNNLLLSKLNIYTEASFLCVFPVKNSWNRLATLAVARDAYT